MCWGCPGDREVYWLSFFATIFRLKTVSGRRPLSPCVLAVLFLAVPGWYLFIPWTALRLEFLVNSDSIIHLHPFGDAGLRPCEQGVAASCCCPEEDRNLVGWHECSYYRSWPPAPEGWVQKSSGLPGHTTQHTHLLPVALCWDVCGLWDMIFLSKAEWWEGSTFAKKKKTQRRSPGKDLARKPTN